MSEATQQDSESNKSYFQVRWPGDSPTEEEFLMLLPVCRSLNIWASTIINGEESIAWDTLESDMRAVSTQHPNTIFTVEIQDEDDRRWVQYHQAGQYYETPEVRHIPDFDPSKLREPRHTDPLDLNTPIVQVPTLQDVLQEALLVIEENVWDLEVDRLPDGYSPAMANPYEFGIKPATPPEAALERVPRLREILTATHQEAALERVPRLREILTATQQKRNQFGEKTERIKDIFNEHVAQVLNQQTFDERRELQALALETLTARNTKPTPEE